jgi:hypothetical protein
MIAYNCQYLGFPCAVSVSSKDADQGAPIQYDGDELAIAAVSHALRSQCGLYGHLIGEATTPIDLVIAMGSPEMQGFSPELIKGKEIVRDYKTPELPPDIAT